MNYKEAFWAGVERVVLFHMAVAAMILVAGFWYVVFTLIKELV